MQGAEDRSELVGVPPIERTHGLIDEADAQGREPS